MEKRERNPFVATAKHKQRRQNHDGKATTAKPRWQSRKGKVREQTAKRKCEPFDATASHKQLTAKPQGQSCKGNKHELMAKQECNPFAVTAKHEREAQAATATAKP